MENTTLAHHLLLAGLLFALGLTGAANIRDVILFPTLAPEAQA